MDDVLLFNCQGKEYVVSITEHRVYPKFIGIIGLIEIGYGKSIIVKSITFDLRKNYKKFLGIHLSAITTNNDKGNSVSFIKEFISKLTLCLSENILDDDIIHIKPISNSRRKLFTRLLTENGWTSISYGDDYFTKNNKYNSAMFEQIRLFGAITISFIG